MLNSAGFYRAEKQKPDGWITAGKHTAPLRVYPTPQEKQKPMHPELRKMWEDYFDKCFREAPSQRQPLTEEEIAEIMDYGQYGGRVPEYAKNFVRAIERKHGITGEMK